MRFDKPKLDSFSVISGLYQTREFTELLEKSRAFDDETAGIDIQINRHKNHYTAQIPFFSLTKLGTQFATISTEISQFYPEKLMNITSLCYLVINNKRFLIASILTEENLKVDFHKIGESLSQPYAMDGDEKCISRQLPDIQVEEQSTLSCQDSNLKLVIKLSQKKTDLINPLMSHMVKLRPFYSVYYDGRCMMLLKLNFFYLGKTYLLDEAVSKIYEVIAVKELEESHPNSKF